MVILLSLRIEEFQTFPIQQCTIILLLTTSVLMATIFKMTTHHGSVFPLETCLKKTSFAVSAISRPETDV